MASPLLWLPAHDLVSRLAAGETTSAELVELCLGQIERHNRRGLGLHAVIAARPRDDAVAEAARLDGERRAGRVRSRLHGMPIVLKDTIVTDQSMGMTTTAGAAVFKHMKARRNADLVDRLIEAGLIVIAKGNMTEYCGFKSKGTPMGWSAVGGQTLSVFRREGLRDEDQPTAGGSSSGPAVSISAGFAPLAIGTETSGSLVFPASVAGLYAIRLTVGSVPVGGLQRISESFDGPGPMARDPRDLAALAGVMVGVDASPWEDAMRKGFGGLKVGIFDHLWGVHNSFRDQWQAPDVAAQWEKVIETMRSGGSEVVYPLEMAEASDALKYKDETMVSVSYRQFPKVMEEFIRCFEPDPSVTSLEDIIAWNEAHAEEAMPEPQTGQTELVAASKRTLSLSLAAEAATQLRRLAGPAGIGRTMEAHGSGGDHLDVVLSSSASTLVSFAACSGWPIGTLPLATMHHNGQPYGMFALAREGREDVLLRLMAAWQAAGLNGVPMPAVR